MVSFSSLTDEKLPLPGDAGLDTRPTMAGESSAVEQEAASEPGGRTVATLLGEAKSAAIVQGSACVTQSFIKRRRVLLKTL
jgi:hypothetical protein